MPGLPKLQVHYHCQAVGKVILSRENLSVKISMLAVKKFLWSFFIIHNCNYKIVKRSIIVHIHRQIIVD